MKVVTKVKYKTKREDKMKTLTINEERERLNTRERRKTLAHFPMHSIEGTTKILYTRQSVQPHVKAHKLG